MTETTRMQPVRVKSKQTARDIVTALDNERKKQEITQGRLSMAMGNPRSVWRQVVERGSCQLETFVRACEVLDVEIVLVDREGDSMI